MLVPGWLEVIGGQRFAEVSVRRMNRPFVAGRLLSGVGSASSGMAGSSVIDEFLAGGLDEALGLRVDSRSAGLAGEVADTKVPIGAAGRVRVRDSEASGHDASHGSPGLRASGQGAFGKWHGPGVASAAESFHRGGPEMNVRSDAADTAADVLRDALPGLVGPRRQRPSSARGRRTGILTTSEAADLVAASVAVAVQVLRGARA